MATVGNNMNIDNTELRDAFLDGSEGEYVEHLIQYIKSGKVVPGISISSMSGKSVKDGLAAVQQVYGRVKDKIKALKMMPEDEKEMIDDLKFYLGLERGSSKLINDIDAQKYAEFYCKDNGLKVIIGETLAEMVDEGLFDEQQMYVVEAQMGLLLASIEDLHMEMILER